MPFAGFKDFAACVGANQDKDSPEAFCAALHKQVTGEFPSEASEGDIEAAESMQKFDTILKNVAIFKAGIHTDSLGNEKEFSKADLQGMIDAFAKGAPPSIPIKLGHSSEDFNNSVAKALGIPVSIIKGEDGTAKGAASLGRITALKLNGHLTADLSLNEKVAQLIKDKLFTGVSAEIQTDRKQGEEVYPLALSGLALLGAQRPALGDLPTLQQATMLEDGSSADSVYFFDNDFAGAVSYHGEGATTVGGASSGGENEKLFDVPFKDFGRGRHVTATVSAPDEITAKRTGLRVVENFLLAAGGPLGGILGGAAGLIAAGRMVAGKPILNPNGVRGLIRWLFEDPYTEEDLDQALLYYSRMVSNSQFVEGASRLVVEQAKEIAEDVVEERLPPEQGKHKILKLLAKSAAVIGAAAGIAIVSGALVGKTLILAQAKALTVKTGRGTPAAWFRVITELTTAGFKMSENGKNTISIIGSQAMSKGTNEFAAHAPEGVSDDAWSSCLASAREAGEDDPEAHCRAKFAEEKEEKAMNQEVVQALKLSETATKEEVVAAITKLQQGQSSFEEAQKLAETVKELQHSGRVHNYFEEVSLLTHTKGEPKERAEKLAKLHESAGEETAKELLASWKETDQFAKAAGITKALLDGSSDNDGSFAKDVAKYQEDNKTATLADATKAVMRANPEVALARND